MHFNWLCHCLHLKRSANAAQHCTTWGHTEPNQYTTIALPHPSQTTTCIQLPSSGCALRLCLLSCGCINPAPGLHPEAEHLVPPLPVRIQVPLASLGRAVVPDGNERL